MTKYYKTRPWTHRLYQGVSQLGWEYAKSRARQYGSKPTKTKRYRQYGMSGTYSGKNRSRKIKASSSYMYKGYQLRTEHGGTIAGSSGTGRGAIYIGHGIAFQKFGRAICGAVIRKLFAKIGVSIDSWEDVIGTTNGGSITGNACQLEVGYSRGATQQQNVISMIFTGDDTYDTMAETMYAQCVAVITTDSPYNWNEITLRFSTNEATPVGLGMPEARFNLNKTKIKWSVYSKMNIQNRSQGASATDDDTNTVDANPITGYVYYGKTNAAFPTVQKPAPSAASGNNVANETNGLMTMDMTTLGANQLSVYTRPPANKSAFEKCTYIKGTTLQPGQIKSYVWNDTKTDNFGYLMNHIGRNELLGPKGHMRIAKYCFIGLEKICRTGTETNVLSIGYEINQFYNAAAIISQQRAQCKVEII